MILILRGLIRDSVNNTNLYNLVKDIVNIEPNIKIYIHTWNIFANSLSWRPYKADEREITEGIIYDYFKDLKDLIKHIIIDDDKNIQLIGNVNGKIPGCANSLKGWKNYIYGKYKIIDYIYNKYENKNEMVINCRFDVLSNICFILNKDIISFIQNNKTSNFDKNIFLKNKEVSGVDNFYIGNINTIYKITKYFYLDLDKILKENIKKCFPEILWYRVNLLLDYEKSSY